MAIRQQLVDKKIIKRHTRTQRFLDGWMVFKENPLGKIGLFLLIVFTLMAIGSFFPPISIPCITP